MTVSITHTTPADDTFSPQGAVAWDAVHAVSGLGSLAEQNANNVSITGGSISGITDLAVADGGTGASTAQDARNNLLPSQGSNTGKFLKTDGTNVSWASVDALPSQTGNNGKYLTTDGSTASWGSLGTMAAQAANNVAITGGSINGTTVGATTPTTGAFTYGTFPSQVSAPATPANGFTFYANATNALSWKGANGYVRTFDGTANTADRTYTLPNASGTVALTSDIPTITAIGYAIDGGGDVITSGTLNAGLYIPFVGTINSVTLLADATGSIVIDILKSSYASYPPTSSICASAKPTLSSARTFQDTTLTGWTTSISAGDTLLFKVDSASTVKQVTVILKVTKT